MLWVSEVTQFLQSGSFLKLSTLRKPKCSAVLVAVFRNSVVEYFILYFTLNR